MAKKEKMKVSTLTVRVDIDVDMVPVESSQIKSVGWIKEDILVVEFNRGGLYTYKNVTWGEYQNLISADSVGSYFSKNIKDSSKYPFTKQG